MTRSFSGKLDHILSIARTEVQKRAFVDPATAGGGGMPPGGGGMPPMDPAAAGGMPPMDPAAMGGGGMPPMDPAMMGGAGGGGGLTADDVRAVIQEEMAAAGGGMGMGGEGQIKPKIDVNVEIMQMKNMMAKIIDAMGIPVSAEEMSATPEKLTAMAAGGDPAAAGGAPPGGGGSAISPIDPMQGASPDLASAKQGSDGEGYDGAGLRNMSDQAAALAHILG